MSYSHTDEKNFMPTAFSESGCPGTSPADVRAEPNDLAQHDAAKVRLSRLRAACAEEGLDAFFVRDLSNIRWLTAFDNVFDDEDAHALLVSQNSAALHTDSRYAEAARKAAESSAWKVDDERISHALFAIKATGDESTSQRTLGIEDSLTLGEYRTLQTAAAGAAAASAAGSAPEASGAAGAAGAAAAAAGAAAATGAAKAAAAPEAAPAAAAAAAAAPPELALRETSNFVRTLRAVKDASEIARLKAAQAITDAAFTHIIAFIRPGMTERAIQIELEDFMRRHGAEDLAFSSIVATGANGASPHAIPGDMRLEAGQCVVLDFGARAHGYCSDMTRMVFLGQPDERMHAAYAALQDANHQVEAALRPGVTGAAMHELAERVLSQHGFAGKMGHGLGHGVGIDIHEEPNLSPRNLLPLEEGNVVTVEPGIYFPNEFGMRLEDFGTITHDGFAVFTQSAHDMVVL